MVNGRRSKAPDVRCKKHPKHKQSPGVCSVCLSEKLSRLSNNTSRSIAGQVSSSSSSSDSLSSYYSSNDSSYSSSPMHRSISAFLVSSKNVLTKSRSMALFVPASASRLRGGEEGSDRGGKKKSGFWSKLLLPISRNKRTNEGLMMHSQTVRERVMVH